MTISNDPAPYWNIWGHYVRAPSASVLALQAALMAKNYFSRAEKKQIPGLTLGFAHHLAALKLAVGGDSDIRGRLSRCGRLDEHGNRYRCQVTLCPRCLMLRRGEETGENIRLFAHHGNEKLAFMTVLVRVIASLDEADALMEQHELKIGNAVRYRRRKDARWNSAHYKAYWEFDHYRDTDALGHNAKRCLPKIGWPEIAFGDSVWLVHCHAIVALGDITIEELKHALRSDSYDEAYQVDIQPFKTHRNVIDNIKDTTRYSMKFRIEDDYKRTGPFDPSYVYDYGACNERKWWPKEAVAAFANHLCKPRGAFLGLQFWLGPKGISKTKSLSPKTTKKRVSGKSVQSERPAIYDMIEAIKGRSVDLNSIDETDTFDSACGGVGACDVEDMSECNGLLLHDTNWLRRWALDYTSRKQADSSTALQQGANTRGETAQRSI